MDGPGVVLMVLALAGLGLPVAGRPAIVGFIGRVSVSSSGAIPRTSYYLTAGTLPAHPPMEKMIELFSIYRRLVEYFSHDVQTIRIARICVRCLFTSLLVGSVTLF